MLRTALSTCRLYGHPTGAASIGSAALKAFEGAKASVDALARRWLVLQSAPGLRLCNRGVGRFSLFRLAFWGQAPPKPTALAGFSYTGLRRLRDRDAPTMAHIVYIQHLLHPIWWTEAQNHIRRIGF